MNEHFDSKRAAARAAAAGHLTDARATIDAAFGEGYAAENPQLVSALVQASAIESAIEAGRQAHSEALSTARELSRATNETILKLKPRLFG